MGVSGQLLVPAALPPGKEPLVPSGGPQSQCEAVVKRKIPSPCRDSNPALYH